MDKYIKREALYKELETGRKLYLSCVAVGYHLKQIGGVRVELEI